MAIDASNVFTVSFLIPINFAMPQVTAVVLANLCVSHIMCSQNEEAEDIMRRIEREEERLTAAEPAKQCLHLCIVNLGQSI